MQRPVTALAFCLVTLGGSAAFADEPVRVHVAGGGAHAVGGTQASEFASGGSGDATVEVPTSARFGVQAGLGAVVLGKGEAANDPGVARTSTGVAFLGTAGIRLRAFDDARVGGPWIDGNVGVARTGTLTRPAVGAHIGWDFRVASATRLDVGPYLGYTQIIQPDGAMRVDDARVLTAGISISLGAKERAKTVLPTLEAPPPPPPLAPTPIEDRDPEELAEANDVCPDGGASTPEGCVGDIRIVENRILLQDIIHFDFGKAKVRGESFRVVKRLAQFINEHPEILSVSIEGHTDEIGTDDYNNALSVDRATAMRELLLWFGAPGKQLHIVGFGKSMLKVVTLKPEEKNRRVELFVTIAEAEEGSGSSPGTTGTSHEKSSR